MGVLERALHARGHQQLLASANDDLHRAACFDTLTGLPNRSAPYERITTLQRERRGAHSAFAAVFVDLNEFMILLMGTAGAETVAETSRRPGQGMVLTLQAIPDPVLVSFSVGEIEGVAPDLSPDEILAIADTRMYEHKNDKRRRPDQ